MDHRTRVELAMMALELRLGARTPPELLARRLSPRRLGEIAAMLEGLIDTSQSEPSATPRPHNDAPRPLRGDAITRAAAIGRN